MHTYKLLLLEEGQFSNQNTSIILKTRSYLPEGPLEYMSFLVIFNDKWLNLLPGALAKNVMDKHIAFQALKQSLRLYD